MVRADAITDYIVRKGPNEQHGLPTQLALLKLLYFVEGWALALLGQSLVQEQIFAWRLGPVVKSQRQRLKAFGSRPIPASIVTGLPEAELSRDERELIDEVWRKYAIENPGSLVGLTHLRGSPWHMVRKAKGLGWDDDSDIPIPCDLIRSYFRDLHARALALSASRAVAQHAAMTAEESEEEQRILLADWQSLADGADIAWVACDHRAA